MVQRTKITLIDDVDGETAADETIQFGLDGVQYEIDLGSAHADQLRASIWQWVDYARQIGGRRKHKAKDKAKTNGHKASATPSSAEVRAWAQSQGVEVPSRGRVPADVWAAFEQANSAA
jgi:hypothetical protein